MITNKNIYPYVLVLVLFFNASIGFSQNTARLEQAKENIHLVAELSEIPDKKNTVEVLYKLYFPLWIGLKNFTFLDIPEYQKFKKEDFGIASYEPITEEYKGSKSRYVILRRFHLYTKNVKPSDIEPTTIQLVIELPTEERDSLGTRIYELVPIELTSRTN